MLNSTTPGYVDLSSSLTFDPEKAKQLLTDDGWIPGDDGIRVKDGKRLTLNVVASYTDLEIIQQQLKAVGIDYPIRKLDTAGQSKALADSDYDIYAWTMTRADPAVLDALYNSDWSPLALRQGEPVGARRAVGHPGVDGRPGGAGRQVTADVQRYVIDNAWGIPIVDRAWTYGVAPSRTVCAWMRRPSSSSTTPGCSSDMGVTGTLGWYLLRRVGQAVFVVWAAFTVSFVILYLLPSDPVVTMLGAGGDGTSVDPAQIAALRTEYGFDQPVSCSTSAARRGASSSTSGRRCRAASPVSGSIAAALPETIKLASVALVLALVVGSLVAVIAASTRSRWLRQVLLSLPPLGVAIPVFWFGLLLLQWFSFRLPLFPGDRQQGILQSLVLPAIALAVPTAAVIAQVLSKSLAVDLAAAVRRDPARNRRVPIPDCHQST